MRHRTDHRQPGCGALALAASAPKLARLKRFLLDHSYVGEQGVRELKRAFGERLELGEIREPDEDDGEKIYYTSVGE